MMWLKKLRQRKFQSIIIFLIAMICSLLLTSAMSIIFSLEKPFWDLVEECKSPSMELFLRDERPESIRKLKQVVEETEGVERTELLDGYSFTQVTTSKNEKIEGFFELNAYKESVHQHLRYTSEKILPLEEGECLLPEVVRQNYDIEVGDTITLTVNDKRYTYKIKGFVVEPYMSSLASSCAFIVHDIPKTLPTTKVMKVYGEQGKSGTELITAIRKNNNGQLNAGARTIEQIVGFSLITGKILGGILFGGGFIILLVSCIIIRFMVRNTLLTDLKTIAIYKTIGYSSKEILKMYMKAYLFLASIGVAVGVISSNFIAYLFLEQAFKTIGIKSGGALVGPALITFSIVLSVVATSIYSVFKDANKVSPVAIFSDRQNTLGKKKTLKPRMSKPLSFSPFNMAMRSMLRERKNTLFIILTAVVSLYGVNFAMASMDNVASLATNNYYWLGFDKSDVFIESRDHDQFKKVYDQVRQDSRVTKVIRENPDGGVEVKWQEGVTEPNLQGYFFDDFSQIDVPVVEGRNPKYPDEIVITTIVAKELGKEVGDYVQIMIEEQPKSFLITGTFQSYYGMGRGVRMLGSSLDTEGDLFDYNNLSIYLKEGVDLEQFIADYEQYYGDEIKVTKREDMFKVILEMITVPQQKALLPFMSFIVLMGFINIFGIVVLRNLNHERTSSIYKSMGYDSMHLLKVNLWYIGIVAIVASIMTLPVFIITYPKLMALALSSFGFVEYPVFYDIYQLVIMNGVVLVIFLISCVLSSQSLFKISIKTLNQE